MVELSPVSQQIWDMKYRLKGTDGEPVDKTVQDTLRRVARSLAANELNPSYWEHIFFQALDGFKFLPAGRILSGADASRNVTLFNCFVMGDIPDSMKGIFDSLKEAALTMQQGGGIGYDFSTLRPKGAAVKGVGADASGPLSFMDVWDAMCRTIMSAGSRRGAMMAVMRCDHPDIEAFIEAKREPGRLRMFNLSVLVTDRFIEAVKSNASWDLTFNGTIYKSLPARAIWDKIMRATYAYAEPGVVFIDRINARNNLHYCEFIHGTNPCGEQPLPPYGACLLGSINLARLVEEPFSDAANINLEKLEELVITAVRMMDNVIDVSNFPLKEQRREALSKRRIGLGITGLADALILCGARYGGHRAVNLTETWLKSLQRAAYMASVGLAREKGSFPLFDREGFLAGVTIQNLGGDIKDAISEFGIRNSLLTSVAPTGTISLFANNVSSGLEPVFSFFYNRHLLMSDGSRSEEEVSDYAYRLYRDTKGEETPLTDAFVDVQDLSPHDHLIMQATVQKYIDSSISKTINVPETMDFEDFKGVYIQAFELGCKGCTTYRPNDITGAVLERKIVEKKEVNLEPELPLEPPAKTSKPSDIGDSGAVAHLFKPLDRPGELPGSTYKLKWPESDHAIYITLNDILDEFGRIRPFEIFINSKNTEHYSWTVALTRMISAVFRRGGDISFVVEELKAVFDPRGGQWMKGKYVPSLLAAIGGVIEEHLINIGFLNSPRELTDPDVEVVQAMALVSGNPDAGAHASEIVVADQVAPFRQCPKCAQASLIHQEGCDTCTSCGYSRCG